MHRHYAWTYVGIRWDEKGSIADFETLRRGVGVFGERHDGRIQAKGLELEDVSDGRP
jgi:hypothetical protein